jgi:hypothetical protein
MPVAYSSNALSLCRNSATLTSTESNGRIYDEPSPRAVRSRHEEPYFASRGMIQQESCACIPT